ncbi:hypothetical protein [Cetobacterium sp.]|uniref:hypothetical protein n=1 Tax=Cetobacterium sp. TaxID=2071632 RepID=UPI003F3EB2BC
MTKYNEYTDTLYVRLTKFANPEININKKIEELTEKEKEQIAKIEIETRNAIISQDSQELARVLGLAYDGVLEKNNVYDLRFLETANVYEKIRNEE